MITSSACNFQIPPETIITDHLKKSKPIKITDIFLKEPREKQIPISFHEYPIHKTVCSCVCFQDPIKEPQDEEKHYEKR